MVRKLIVIAHDKESEKILVEILNLIRALQAVAGKDATLPNLSQDEILMDIWDGHAGKKNEDYEPASVVSIHWHWKFWRPHVDDWGEKTYIGYYCILDDGQSMCSEQVLIKRSIGCIK